MEKLFDSSLSEKTKGTKTIKMEIAAKEIKQNHVSCFSKLNPVRCFAGIFKSAIDNLINKNTCEELVIAHLNDTHSAASETAESIGYAKIKTVVDQLREDKNLILLDAGDTLHGEPFATLSKGESISKVMNAIKYDAMTLGNHDFTYGRKRLMELENMLQFPIIAANIVKEDDKRAFKPYTIKKIHGLKVGIFGLSTPETSFKARAADVKGLKFLSPEETAREMVAQLKEKKVDVIIALSHLGLNGEFTSMKLANEVAGIDIIVDGHSHSALENGITVKDTLIVQAGEKTKNLGVVKLKIKNKRISGKKAYLLSKEQFEKIKPEPKLKAYIDNIEKLVAKEMSLKVGILDRKLDGERVNSRTKETELGSLIAASMKRESGADAAILNGGGIRASLERGNVTKGDILMVMPFENTLVLKELKGKELLGALENGVSGYPEEYGGFAQLSGLTVKFDSSKEAGSRVVEAKINGENISLNKTYKVAFSRTDADGGDGFVMVGNGPELAELDSLDKVLIKHIQKYGFIDAAITNKVQDISTSKS